MAKRTQSRSSTAIVRAYPVRQAAPIIRVSAPRTTKKKHHRRSRVGGGGGTLNQKTMMAAAIGGAVMGFVDKNFPTLPTLPLLGRAGTIALAAYMLSGRGGIGSIARDVALAGAAVAGYELGKTGAVSGDGVMGEVVPQVHGAGGHRAHGLASQV